MSWYPKSWTSPVSNMNESARIIGPAPHGMHIIIKIYILRWLAEMISSQSCPPGSRSGHRRWLWPHEHESQSSLSKRWSHMQAQVSESVEGWKLGSKLTGIHPDLVCPTQMAVSGIAGDLQFLEESILLLRAAAFFSRFKALTAAELSWLLVNPNLPGKGTRHVQELVLQACLGTKWWYHFFSFRGFATLSTSS